MTQTDASLDRAPVSMYSPIGINRAVGCMRSSMLICIYANAPPVGKILVDSLNITSI